MCAGRRMRLVARGSWLVARGWGAGRVWVARSSIRRVPSQRNAERRRRTVLVNCTGLYLQALSFARRRAPSSQLSGRSSHQREDEG